MYHNNGCKRIRSFGGHCPGSLSGVVQWGRGNCPGVYCPGVYCPGSYCPGVIGPGVIVLLPSFNCLVSIIIMSTNHILIAQFWHFWEIRF